MVYLTGNDASVLTYIGQTKDIDFLNECLQEKGAIKLTRLAKVVLVYMSYLCLHLKSSKELQKYIKGSFEKDLSLVERTKVELARIAKIFLTKYM